MLRGGHLALGLAIGALCTLFLFLFLDMFGNILTVRNEYWAAILGALTGGAFTVLGSALENQQRKEEREANEKKQGLQMAYSLYEHLNGIASGLSFLKSHFSHCFSQARESQIDVTQFAPLAILPLSSRQDRIRIPYELKTFLIVAGYSDLYNKIGALDLRTIGLLDAFDRAMDDRQVLMSLIDLKDADDGWEVIHEERDADEVRGRMITLNNKLHEIPRDLEKLISLSLETIADTVRVINDLSDSVVKIELKPEYKEVHGDALAEKV